MDTDLWDANVKKAEADLGIAIPEVYWILAKSVLLGMTVELIADTYGFPVEQVREITETQMFLDIKGWLAQSQQVQTMKLDQGWDMIETEALRHLGKQVNVMRNDGDFILKVAALANKANRRQKSSFEPVNAPDAGAVVNLVLDQRIVNVLASGQGFSQSNRSFAGADSEKRLDELKMPALTKVYETLDYSPDNSEEASKPYEQLLDDGAPVDLGD